jgi:hypothetical protein
MVSYCGRRQFSLSLIAVAAVRLNHSDAPLAMEIVMTKQDDEWRAQVRLLNDQFRVRGLGLGSFMHTDGVHERGPQFVLAAVLAVRSFSDFTVNNDPYREHDFGAFEIDGEKLFFKIDYYDLKLEAHSPDAADAVVTHRVLTIMLANEY